MPHANIQTTPLRSQTGLFQRMLTAFSVAHTRRRERHRLAQLDTHILRDIGLDAQDARRECAKPFWQP